MTRKHAELLIKIHRLLNQHPRFGPGDRRLRFDSYSVVAELDEVLTRAGYDVTARAQIIDEMRR